MAQVRIPRNVFAIAEYNYNPQSETEIKLRIGDYVKLIEEVSLGWSRGTVLATNASGYFPTSFVKSIPASEVPLAYLQLGTNLQTSVSSPSLLASPSQAPANNNSFSPMRRMTTVTPPSYLLKAESEKLETVRASYDWKGRDEQELSFKKGDVIEVISKSNTHWWEGKFNGKRGWFPTNYTTPISLNPEMISVDATLVVQKQMENLSLLTQQQQRELEELREATRRLKEENSKLKTKNLEFEQDLKLYTDPTVFSNLPLKQLRDLRQRMEKVNAALLKKIDEKHDSANEENNCKVCTEKPREMVFLPCSHICVCQECTKLIRTSNNQCPICRKKIDECFKVFLA